MAKRIYDESAKFSRFISRHYININKKKNCFADFTCNHGIYGEYMYIWCLLGQKTPIIYCLARLGYQLLHSFSISIFLSCVLSSCCLLYKCFLWYLLLEILLELYWKISQNRFEYGIKRESMSVGSFGLIVLGFWISIVMEITLYSMVSSFFTVPMKFFTLTMESIKNRENVHIQTHTRTWIRSRKSNVL